MAHEFERSDAPKPPTKPGTAKPEMLAVFDDDDAPSPVGASRPAYVGYHSPPKPAPVSKHDLLDAAKAATKDRGLNYGKPEANFERIAARWRVHLKNRFGVHLPIDGVSVAIMLGDMKTARLENAPSHLDSWVDLAGYAACGAEIAMAGV